MKAKLIYILFISFLFNACKPEAINPETGGTSVSTSGDIIFGHFHGFCMGERCIEIFKIEGNKLFEDTLDNYPNSSKAYEGKYIALEASKFELVKDLRSKIPSQLFNHPNGIIGSPDASDGGGIYIQVKVDGQTRFWLIDKLTHHIPEYLRPLVEEINETIKVLE